MKTICISVDCSCHMSKMKEIRNILKYDVIDLLKFNFKVNGIIQDGVFLKIYFDAEGVDVVYSDYLSISKYVQELVNRFLWARGFDLIVAAYTDQLPKELRPSDLEVLAELRRRLSEDEEISIPKNVVMQICRFCEDQAIYDKLGRYGDFYYTLKKKLGI